MPNSRNVSRNVSRTASRTVSRAAASARTEILTQLKDDHKRVKKAYRDFQKLDIDEDPEGCAALVVQVLDELTVHATLEEELLYPAARGAVKEEDLVDEAEVEHESVRALIEQLRGMGPTDDKYAARFTVLCEFVMHHVKEEEGEMFPQLESARLDWESLASQMTQRRAELMPSEEAEPAIAAEGRMPESARKPLGGKDASISGRSSTRASASRGSGAARNRS